MKGITLIGMPAAGKSTIGRLLAKKLGWPVYDIDLVMEKKKAMPRAQIIKQNGPKYVKKFEARCVLELDLEDAILAPGGSIIYGQECHDHLRRFTNIVWLQAPIKLIETRLADDPNNERGVLGLEDGGLQKLFDERNPKYEALAHVTVRIEGKSAEKVAQEILRKSKTLIQAS